MTLPEFQTAQIRHAFAMLTRLPVGSPGKGQRLADAAWSFPLVGIGVAVLQALAGWIALWFGLPPMVAAGVALLIGLLATGALHEDGLADTADGMGAWDKAQRLEIMRDSSIGSFGTLALIFAFGLRWTALASLFAAGWVLGPLLIAASASRAAMGAVMTALPPAREEGLGHDAGRPDGTIAVAGLAIAALVALLLGKGAFAPVLIAAAAAATGVAMLAKSRLGGQTGDILGATQLCCEIAVLLALLTAL